MYILITFLGVLGTWGVARLCRQPLGRPALWGWVVLMLASVLNLYSSPFTIFMVAAHWLVVAGLVWFHRGMLKPYLIFGTLVALLFIPGILHIYPMADGSASVVSGKPWPYDDLYRLHNMTLFHFAGLVESLEISLVIGSVLGMILAAQRAPVLSLIALLAFYLPILSFHVLEPHHFFNPRYLSYAQPLMLLLVGVALVWLWDQSIGRMRFAKHVAMVGPMVVGMAAVTLASSLSLAGEIGQRVADWKGAARTIIDAQEDEFGFDLVVIAPKWNDNSLLYNMDQVSAPGKRVRLISGSTTSAYRNQRRKRLQIEHPEMFAGPLIRFLAKKDMTELESIADGHRGRIWAITTERPRLLRQIGFERVYRMPRYLAYYGGNVTRGPGVYMRPAR